MTTSAHPRPRRRLPVWAWSLPLLSVLAAAAIPAVWYYGFAAVRDATDGQLQETVTDPLAPGYEAIVEPSATLLAFGTDDQGELAWTAVMALGTADQGGSVLLLAPETLVFSSDGERPLAELFAESPDLAVGGVAILADMGFGGVEVVEPDQLAALVEPLGDFDVTLADALTRPVGTTADDGDESADGAAGEDGADESADGAPGEDGGDDPGPGSVDGAGTDPDQGGVQASEDVSTDGGEVVELDVVRPAGPGAVTPDELAEVLAWTNPGESPVNRLLRQEAVWSAWLDALAAAPDPDQVLPGESDVGIVRFLRGLAAGSHEVRDAPGAPRTEDGAEMIAADGEAVRGLLLDMVPFPAPAFPGDRPKVRLLDGRPANERLLTDAATLVAARAEISIIGNADTFGRPTTIIEYHTEQAEDWAMALRDALGVGEVVAATAPDNVIDITVTLGQDLT